VRAEEILQAFGLDVGVAGEDDAKPGIAPFSEAACERRQQVLAGCVACEELLEVGVARAVRRDDGHPILLDALRQGIPEALAETA